LPGDGRVPLINIGVFDAPDERPAPALRPSNAGLSDLRAAWSLEDYGVRFERLHGYLRKGDCYQGNLTFPATARWDGEPRAIFDAMTARQPVRYGALVDLGGPVVLSRSPELFFAVDR